jgi:hypothetical protein
MQKPRLRFVLELVVITLVVGASMIALGVWQFHRPEQIKSGMDSRAPEETSQAEKAAVSLRAETHHAKSGPIIQLKWNASANAVRLSPYGILYIYDGGIPRQRRIERRALDSGSTSYTPVSDEVTFHLVLPKGRSEGESLVVLLGAPGKRYAQQ